MNKVAMEPPKLTQGEEVASNGPTTHTLSEEPPVAPEAPVHPKPPTAFISGPIDADDLYFGTHYRPAIDQAIAQGHNFAIGPVPGIDTLSLKYLLSSRISPSRITIYMANFEFANPNLRQHFLDKGVNIESVGGIEATTRDRDAQMTKESDYDILRYRTEEEAKALYESGWWPRVSNTEMNERRRRGITSQAYRLHGVGGEPAQKKDSEAEQSGVRRKVKDIFRRG